MIYINPLKFAWRQVLQPPTATPFRRTWPRQMTRVCGKASFRPCKQLLASPSIMKVVPPIHCFHVCSFNFKVWPRDPQSETHCSCRMCPTKLPRKQPTLKESSSKCVSVSTCKEDCTDPRQKKHQTASNGGLIRLSKCIVHYKCLPWIRPPWGVRRPGKWSCRFQLCWLFCQEVVATAHLLQY